MKYVHSSNFTVIIVVVIVIKQQQQQQVQLPVTGVTTCNGCNYL